MPATPIVPSFASLLQAFAPCFSAPTFESLVVLCTGWILLRGRHCITKVVQAAGAEDDKHIRSFHRFFSTAVWSSRTFSRTLVSMAVALVAEGEAVVAVVDDTLGRHTGKHIASAAMHRDPLLSTGKQVVFHWGHNWVVLGINVWLFGKTWCLPVMARLYRTEKYCKKHGVEFRKKTALAAEMIGVLSEWLPKRHIVLLGDSDYSNRALMQKRPGNVHFVGKSRLDASLYAPPLSRKKGQMGRPRVKGERLASPEEQAALADAPWREVEVHVYGKRVTVRALVIDALWYKAGGSQLVRLVLVRGFPGHKKDDVFVSTDATKSVEWIITTYSCRWPTEQTFHDAKGYLGFEQPQNRTERAVRRTAPMALWLYTLTVVWYARVGSTLVQAQPVSPPWRGRVAGPSFGDMLATLRKATWQQRLSAMSHFSKDQRQALEPLVDAAAMAA